MFRGYLKESMKLTRNGYVFLAVLVCMAASRFTLNQLRYFLEPTTNETEVGGVLHENNNNNVIREKSPINIEKQLEELHFEENCFCNLQGAINDDCSCQVDAVDQFNNFKIYPRLQSLLVKNYFRYIQVNLKKECPYWTDDSTCSFEFCQVQPCGENDVPAGIKGRKGLVLEKLMLKDVKEPKDCTSVQDLGSINTTLSVESQEGFERWKIHDESLAEFCTVPDDEDDQQAQYVDLLLNPERYTGYRGPSAHRVWNSIYSENCFRDVQSKSSVMEPFTGPQTEGSCIEKRTFYRAISGLHSSINIHLSAKYLLSDNKAGGLFKPKGGLVWGPNVTEFRQHFENARTAGEASQWLKNLYFLYLLELRAVAKISGYLQQFDLYTGVEDEDQDVKYAIRDLLRVVEKFPFHFDENALFSGADAVKLKAEFHTRFTNITKIMDCVGCQKCKLWGKVQIKGLGTALKILFAESFAHQRGSFLTRNEIVALFNAFGRLSESIYELENFRRLLKTDDNHQHLRHSSDSQPPSSQKSSPQKFMFRR